MSPGADGKAGKGSGNLRWTSPPSPDGHHAEVWPVAGEWGWLVLDRNGWTVADGVVHTEAAAKELAGKHLRVAALRSELGLDAQ